MRRAIWTTVLAVSLAMTGTLAIAQKTTQVHAGAGGSPHVKTEWMVDGASLSIEYGRPSLKGRPETQLMPHGQPWRTGADEPTLLTTNRPLKFGALTLEPGTHTINTIPGATEWQLLVGKHDGQGGIPYRPDLEKGRAPMQLERTTATTEVLAISIDDTPTGGTLRIEWGTARATIPFTVG